MRLRDLLVGDDGKMSQAKLAAATGHFLMAASFLKIQVLGAQSHLDFSEGIWTIYGLFAIGHPIVNKSLDLVRQVKEKTAETNVEIAKTTGQAPTSSSGAVVTTTKTEVEQ